MNGAQKAARVITEAQMRVDMDCFHAHNIDSPYLPTIRIGFPWYYLCGPGKASHADGRDESGIPRFLAEDEVAVEAKLECPRMCEGLGRLRW